MTDSLLPDKTKHEENRRAWNAATQAHNSHKADKPATPAAGGQMGQIA